VAAVAHLSPAVREGAALFGEGVGVVDVGAGAEKVKPRVRTSAATVRGLSLYRGRPSTTSTATSVGAGQMVGQRPRALVARLLTGAAVEHPVAEGEVRRLICVVVGLAQ